MTMHYVDSRRRGGADTVRQILREGGGPVHHLAQDRQTVLRLQGAVERATRDLSGYGADRVQRVRGRFRMWTRRMSVSVRSSFEYAEHRHLYHQRNF